MTLKMLQTLYQITCVLSCNLSFYQMCSGADPTKLNKCRQFPNWNVFHFCCLNKTAVWTVSFHFTFPNRTWQGKAACSSMHFIHAENWKKWMECKHRGQHDCGETGNKDLNHRLCTNYADIQDCGVSMGRALGLLSCFCWALEQDTYLTLLHHGWPSVFTLFSSKLGYVRKII